MVLKHKVILNDKGKNVENIRLNVNLHLHLLNIPYSYCAFWFFYYTKYILKFAWSEIRAYTKNVNEF